MTGNQPDPNDPDGSIAGQVEALADTFGIGNSEGLKGSPKSRIPVTESDAERKALDEAYSHLPQTPTGSVPRSNPVHAPAPTVGSPVTASPYDVVRGRFYTAPAESSEDALRSAVHVPIHGGRPILDAEELADLTAVEATPKRGYTARALGMGKRIFTTRGGLAGLLSGIVAGAAIAGGVGLRNEDKLYNDTMHGASVTYAENVGLGDNNVMRIHDDNNDNDPVNDIVYTYVDQDGTNLNFSKGNNPLVKKDIEKLTVLYDGKATTFDSEDIRTPEEVELFRVHNELYNLALDNVVAERNRPEETRRSYILDRSKSLLERFKSQPAYKPQPKGPLAE